MAPLQRRAGFKDAYRAFVGGGWIGLSADPDYGGQGLPYTLAAIVNEFASSANMAFAMYPGLSQGALAALMTHGTAEQKKIFVPKLISGEWSGTMNLTESHCGTDLGLLKTKAVPKLTVPLRFSAKKSSSRPASMILPKTSSISCSPGSRARPPASRASRCFVVPKFLIEADGSLGALQQSDLRLDRTQDGHSRQCHLRDEL